MKTFLLALNTVALMLCSFCFVLDAMTGHYLLAVVMAVCAGMNVFAIYNTLRNPVL